MTKSKKAGLIVIILLFLVWVAVFISCYNQEGFTGSRVKNPDAYLQENRKSNTPSDRYMNALRIVSGAALGVGVLLVGRNSEING